MGKNAYGRNNAIVGGAIRAVDRVAHAILPPRGGRIVPE